MSDRVKMIAAAVLLLAAVVVALLAMNRAGPGDLAYYYDLSEQRLYTAPAGQIPPHRGVGGEAGDGVLAVVYVCGEDRKSKAERKIAYLMTYSPELGALMARAAAAVGGDGTYPEQLEDRVWVSTNTLVRAPDDAEWHAMNSAEGQAALAVLSMECEDGRYPTVCSPAD